MLTVKEAVTKLLSYFSPLPVETISFDNALGRTLAEQTISDQSFPSFDNSSMDGYAVKANDLKNASPDNPKSLQIIEEIPAGFEPNLTVSSGKASRIMTGAKLPQGADAVIPIEDTNQTMDMPESASSVEFYQAVKPGDNIRKMGDNFSPGDLLIPQGREIRPQETALLAMQGKTSIKVYQKPKIGLLVTGDELVSPDESLAPGKIRDSNSYMLTSLLKNQQVEIINSGIIEDSEEKIKLDLKRLIDEKVDLIVTTGGVSMGAYDYVRKVIEDQGSLEFWRVNIKPGKPLAFGYLEKTPIIGLPGNPVSAYVGFHVFILPVINKLAGKEYHPPFLIQARLQSKLQSNTRESYIPAYVESDHHQHTVSPVKNQSSGNLFSLVLTNALIILPGGVEFFNEGDMVNVWKINCNNI